MPPAPTPAASRTPKGTFGLSPASATPSAAQRCSKGPREPPVRRHSPSSSQCSARRFSSSVIITRVMTWSGTRRPRSRYCFAKTPTSVQVKEKKNLKKCMTFLLKKPPLPLKFCLPSESAHPGASRQHPRPQRGQICTSAVEIIPLHRITAAVTVLWRSFQ